MKNPFARDPDAALDRARSDLFSVEAQIGALQVERATKLADGVGVADIEPIDLKVEKLQREIRIHRERISVLEAKQRDRHRQSIEASRAAAITATRKKIEERVALAADLEKAIKVAAEAMSALLQSGDVVTEWPDGLAVPFAPSEHQVLRAEVAYLIFVADLPAPARPNRFEAPSLTGAVENLGAALIAQMETAQPLKGKAA
ncbi:hypothetical protein Q3C01_01095 [Bradyrhizobium sp. UFLA05-109]